MFEEQYKRLNKKQKEAVDVIEGPVMVIAGPGTGKTSILTLRIANILNKTDTRPEQILALTFTESGVQSMRTKLIDIMGPVAYKVNIFTFHGFANTIIKRHPDQFPRIISSENASEVEKIEIIEQAIDGSNFEYIKPYGDTHFYVPSLLASIKHLKRENISVSEFKKIIEKDEKEYGSIDDLEYETGAHQGKIKGKYKDLEKNIKKNKELLKIYEQYQAELAKRKLYDFDDMLLELISAMKKDADFLLILQEEYQYILADEHQDANNSQNAILELLANFHEDPNLFIVGDEKQAIFRFQGASLENFLYFKNLYKNVKLISLEDNYRSTQSILDSAHELASYNNTNNDLQVILHSAKINPEEKPEEKIALVECEKEDDERNFVAESISRLLREGVLAKDIAILFRKNRESDAIGDELANHGIPFSIYSDKDMLADPDVRKLLLIFSAVDDPSNDALISEISFFGIFELSVENVFNALSKARKSRGSLLNAYKQDDELSSFMDDILRLSSAARNEDLISFLDIFLNETEWGAKLIKTRHPLQSLSAFDAFLGEIKKFAELDRSKRLSDFLKYLRTIEDYRIRIQVPPRDERQDAVSLMTAHKAKGLEFEHVFILGLTDKNWGNVRDMHKFRLPYQSSSHIDDDRRLFYVSLTRAKRKVVVTYSLNSTDGRTYLPSQFLLELKQDLIERQSHGGKTSSLEKRKIDRKREDLFDKEYLRRVFLNESFSVTALNNYLSCPWKYFFRNLARLPEIQNKHQLYGIAVHSALKDLCYSLSHGKALDKESFVKAFEYDLRHKPLSLADFNDSLHKGQKALEGYYDTYHSTWGTNLLCEYNISGIPHMIKGAKKEVFLRGILDKIELSKPDAHEAQNVHVVDYKTRKPLSRNEIEGKTKNATGDYKRQLIFYKFLLENEPEKRYSMESGEIDFIEPDESGKYKKERFDITNSDIEELKVLISDVTSEIYKFEFFDKGCDEDDCKECRLAKLLRSS